eukprot:CAMPEP_0201932460 /NCGR_PEP_ID=MMETSP0903-20130614/29569_1 /ASSEMBLY_ACC=CAM_ASM_000552 /TAXON_ID=420261 /ORGANISM="Thalassiosira antarctica, Strain CCMP982" /LENGTH=95 /DNA_ID=CAMNT_0048472101 /DNA_START=62 /DNA_END=346 /DNA_ORIENTATION=+
MTKPHPPISAPSVMGRHLLAFSLVAGSLLVADSLAIHQSPFRTSSSRGGARYGRRRSPSGRLEKDNVHLSIPSLLMASSQSQTPSDDDNDIIDAV